MTTVRPLVRLIPTVLLGAASTIAITRSVAAFATGVVATLVPLAVVWSSGWGCASEVDGVVVEHDCAEPPPSTTSGAVPAGRGDQ